MPRVLLTAFRPYDRWQENASWLALMELTRDLPPQHAVTTRLYPVDFAALPQRLAEDLAENYDVALHLGQAPGSCRIALETIGLNVRGPAADSGEPPPLVVDGPLAYRSELPLAAWAQSLREAGFPANVSFHAGTFLCNAALYWSHHLIATRRLATRTAFIHLPLDTAQAVRAGYDGPTLPAAIAAQALRRLLEQMFV